MFPHRRSTRGNGKDGAPAARRFLLEEIAREARETGAWTGRPAFASRVMTAMATVPREEFAAFGRAEAAYVNAPHAIGCGQTISQPYIVALMTDLLDPAADHVVLEIGTGSGYQAAVLSLLVRRLYSIEIVAPLAAAARARLARLGYDNVVVCQGDGARGWPEHAPYDGIIVTAAAPEIPPALVAQLRPGGRMVIPLGQPGESQMLVLVTRDADGAVSRRDLLAVAFVPLTGVPLTGESS